MKLKITLLVAAMAVGGAAAASGHSAEAAGPWTAATLKGTLAAMPEGDAERGGVLHQERFCASCHGARGEATTRNWPSLAGQRPEYTFKMLLDYRDDRRDEDGRAHPMIALADNLTEQQMADLAAWYAAAPVRRTAPGAADPDALRLVRRGDPVRLLAPCASCHGLDGQGGKNETPALAGQRHEYLVRTMRAFRDGRRANDAHHGMGQFAMPLTDAEIESLARLYAGLD